ncbi:hypothetical protein GGX14DRAFT_378942 [Mycena pura]|uniref:Uncharacterized protein n=1 Tax=Mycena pura TaxID=153505 RepID=A0AAD6UZ74_9AGAR|nr:hypothetical protein GGX14DRAFT_378942 [Mycena pura]
MSQRLHLSSTEIAIFLDMPLRVVQQVRQVWNEVGEVARHRTRSGRAPLMSRVAVDMMLGMLEHTPDLYLDEIQEQLLAVHGLELSLRTICHTLKQLGMTSKKAGGFFFFEILSKPAAERCEEARREFALEVGKYPPEYLVTADESAVNLLTTYHINGWSHKGTRSRKACNFVRGTRCVSLISGHPLLPTDHSILTQAFPSSGDYCGRSYLYHTTVEPLLTHRSRWKAQSMGFEGSWVYRAEPKKKKKSHRKYVYMSPNPKKPSS